MPPLNLSQEHGEYDMAYGGSLAESYRAFLRCRLGGRSWSPDVSEQGPYRPVSRAYERRYHYVYRRHVFDKLRALDLALAEFQQLLGNVAREEERLVTVYEPEPGEWTADHRRRH